MTSLAALLLASLFLGLLWNQIYSEGLPWRLLKLAVPDGSRSAAWIPVATDSAFAFWIRGDRLFLDLRPAEAYAQDHIPGALNRPFLQYFNAPLDLPLERPVLVYDFEVHSQRAVLMVQALKKRGVEASFLRNGYQDWLNYGFPQERLEGE